MAIAIGQSAPEFMLYDSAKNKVSLLDFRGHNVVLLFFPFAFSGTCTKELCAVNDDFSEYEKLDTFIFGISVDSLYTNAKYKEVYRLSFPLLSDFNKEVSIQYDSLLENFAFDYRGVSKRSVFLINREGRVSYMEILPDPGDYPDLNKLKAAIKGLSGNKE